MKKIWSYVAAFFAGLSVGLVAMYKLMGDQIEINIKKVKNKRVGSSSVEIPINVESRENRRKTRKKRK